MKTTHPIKRTGSSQAARILRRLKKKPGAAVSMPALSKASGSLNVHSRIADLRKRGHRIEHYNRYQGTTCCSYYRLIG